MSADPGSPLGTFDADTFALLARVEESNPWFRSRNLLIQWALRSYFPAARDVLDVGCGTGHVLLGLRRAFPSLQLTGVEAGEAGIAIARKRVPDATFVVADVRRLRYQAAFDVTCAFDVLEHVDDDRAVLDQLHRAGRTGGGLLLTVPQHTWLWSASDTSAGHLRRYERHALVELVERSGFHVLRATSFVSLLLPALAIIRLIHGRNTAYAAEVELRPRPVLDRIAGVLYAAERRIVAGGVSFPIGGSLLVVARRV